MPRTVRLSGKPSLRVERSHFGEDCLLIAGMDEVGRGALAGPVSVGVAVVNAQTRTAPTGLKDSKLLTPAVRQAMVPRVRRWAVDHAVGHATSLEIDEIGIIAALRLAGQRALEQLQVMPDLVILDGNHDYLTPPGYRAGVPTLFDDLDSLPPHPRVITMIKGDMRCSSVAAASVLAKTARDAAMVGWALDHPGYEWEINKGYAAPAHLAALRRLGPSPLHRVSWQLPELVIDHDELPLPIADTVDPEWQAMGSGL